MEKGYVIVLPYDAKGEMMAPVKVDFEYQEVEYTFRPTEVHIFVDNKTGLHKDDIEKSLKDHFEGQVIEDITYLQDSPNSKAWAERKQEEAERVQRLGF